MKVLIAVDGSAGSFEAVDQIGRVLAAERDEVALYCSPPDVQMRTYRPDPKLLARAQQGFFEAVFDEARKRLPETLEGRVHTIAGTHDPRRGVQLEAEAWSADVVAVGARGLSTLERLLLGSVSRAVVHHSTIPVWVARAKPGGQRRTNNVLVACENPELGRSAVELLGRFTWPAGTSFATLSVVQSIFAGRVPEWLQQQARGPDVEAMVQAWAREHEEELHGCRAQMQELVGSQAPPLDASRCLVGEGEPAREILSAIQKEDIDLVVVGSKHKRTLGSMILGSTSEAVLNHANCSVLVVPH
jgi:nucleotide-binding universal stress UspA family protein